MRGENEVLMVYAQIEDDIMWKHREKHHQSETWEILVKEAAQEVILGILIIK